LRERYGDDPSTHLDFNPDLWMEVRSSDRLDKNRLYGLSTTTAENLRAVRNVSTVGSSQSVSSTQWNNNTLNSRQIINTSTKWSWTLDQRWVMIHIHLLFGRFVPGMTSFHHLLPLPLRYCSSLIFFWKQLNLLWILFNFIFIFLMFNTILFT
jgi:hypothetical protein